LELAQYLVEQGHKSLVISQGGTMVDQLVRQGSGHLRMPYIGEKTPRSLLHWLPLRNLFKSGSVDILHLRSRLPAWVAYLAWKSLPMRQRPYFITTFHGFYSVNRYSAIMARGQRVIAISRAIADHIHTVYQVPESRIEIIYRGVDVRQFHPDRVGEDRVGDVQKKWGVYGSEAPIIVLPGRVTFWKGHTDFMHALAMLRHRSWRAVCVGAYDAGSNHFRSLLKEIDALRLGEVVKFVGHETDMPAVYAAADIVVSAASEQAEAFGRISIEAQAMARPIIASAHGGSLETIEHGRTGWLYRPGDRAALSEALDALLSDRDLCRQFGRNGFERVHSGFTTRKMCRHTLNLYRQSLGMETQE